MILWRIQGKIFFIPGNGERYKTINITKQLHAGTVVTWNIPYMYIMTNYSSERAIHNSSCKELHTFY